VYSSLLDLRSNFQRPRSAVLLIRLQFAPPSSRANKIHGGSLGLEMLPSMVTGKRNSPLVSLVTVTVKTFQPSPRQGCFENLGSVLKESRAGVLNVNPLPFNFMSSSE
jgi:hypothetical protein